jgi:hypothetical protein
MRAAAIEGDVLDDYVRLSNTPIKIFDIAFVP